MERPFLLAVLAAACVFLVFGISLPLIELKRLYVFSQTPSLLGMIRDLWNNGDVMLAAIVLTFSVLLPMLKLALLTRKALRLGSMEQEEQETRQTPNAGHRLANALARWSMLDVMVVALLVFAAKTSGLASVSTQPGFWCFVASVFLGALASAALKTKPD